MISARRRVPSQCRFWSDFLVAKTRTPLKKICHDSFPGVEDNYEIKCKKGSDNARLVFQSQAAWQQFLAAHSGEGFLHTTENTSGSAQVCGTFRAARVECMMNVRWESSWLLFGMRPLTSSPTTLSTQKESRLHLLSTEGMPHCVSWTSFQGSRCPFSRLSWSTAPTPLKSTKKQSSCCLQCRSRGAAGNGTCSQRKWYIQ